MKKIRRSIGKAIKVLKELNYGEILLVLIGIAIGLIIYYNLSKRKLSFTNANTILTSILTINSVFSAILITYLFTRITWTKDRKLEIQEEAINLSQKVTEFRRILNVLISYYGVWESDKKTKSLLDFNEFKHVEYYDYRQMTRVDYKPKNHPLIEKLYKDENFSEGQSVLYLAISTLVKQRKADYVWQQELYKDYQQKGIYNPKIVEKWIEYEIMDTIAYWLSNNYTMINFYALKNHNEFILSAATKINKKYEHYEVSNKLIRELAEDMSAHYLPELYSCLNILKKGIESLNLLLIVLISFSIIFGVLLPFLLLLIIFDNSFFPIIINIVATVNAALISYFIIKFPFLINKELKWM